jgi:hypothetical protein
MYEYKVICADGPNFMSAVGALNKKIEEEMIDGWVPACPPISGTRTVAQGVGDITMTESMCSVMQPMSRSTFPGGTDPVQSAVPAETH